MNTATFQLEVAEAIGDQVWIQRLRDGVDVTSQYILVQVPKNTTLPLFEIKSFASTPESAKSMLLASVRKLAERHAALAEPVVDRLQKDLRIAKTSALVVESNLEAINKLVLNGRLDDVRYKQYVMLTELRVQRESEAFRLRQLINTIETALSEPSTKKTTMLEDVFVADVPIIPNKNLLLVFGFSGGLLVSIIFVFVFGVGVNFPWKLRRGERT
jgi:hypothetical protein